MFSLLAGAPEPSVKQFPVRSPRRLHDACRLVDGRSVESARHSAAIAQARQAARQGIPLDRAVGYGEFLSGHRLIRAAIEICRAMIRVENAPCAVANRPETGFAGGALSALPPLSPPPGDAGATETPVAAAGRWGGGGNQGEDDAACRNSLPIGAHGGLSCLVPRDPRPGVGVSFSFPQN